MVLLHEAWTLNFSVPSSFPSGQLKSMMQKGFISIFKNTWRRAEIENFIVSLECGHICYRFKTILHQSIRM